MILTWEQIRELFGENNGSALEEDFKDQKTQTSFSNFPGGANLIYRFLRMEDKHLDFATISFLFIEDRCWQYDSVADHFEVLDNGYISIFEILELHLKKNNQILTAYTTEIENLEDFLYERKVPAVFMDLWFDLKKDTARIERYFNRQVHSFNDFEKWAEKQTAFPIFDLTAFAHDIKFSLSNANAALSRLDSIYNYFSSIKNDKLNKNIYLLTMISGIFLPLNLIVGFFGMNTEGLFFKENPHGTAFVAYLLGGILLFCLVGFNIFHLVDRYLLRFFLGQTDIYKQVTTKVNKLEKALKIKV